jgi:hypothetical protein
MPTRERSSAPRRPAGSRRRDPSRRRPRSSAASRSSTNRVSATRASIARLKTTLSTFGSSLTNPGTWRATRPPGNSTTGAS